MSDPATYRTIAEPASTSFSIRGSRFIGHVAPADSVAAAEDRIERVREEYNDATHNVPAYRVRIDGPDPSAERGRGLLREYASDDGEPSSSAGKPVLNVLQGRELEAVVCVVTRYYGGTNLGVGGLVSAYGNAANGAIDAAGVIERLPHRQATVRVAYDDSGTVRGILESESIEFEATYETQVSFEIRVPEPDAATLFDRLRSATSGRARIE